MGEASGTMVEKKETKSPSARATKGGEGERARRRWAEGARRGGEARSEMDESWEGEGTHSDSGISRDGGCRADGDDGQGDLQVVNGFEEDGVDDWRRGRI